MTFRIALLDDWQDVALRLADWSAVQRQAELVVFRTHLQQEEAARVLQDFDAVCLMRERMPMPGALIDRLPRLQLICTTGARHRELDHDAAAVRGIRVVAAPGSDAGSASTIELAWGLILALARRIPDEVQAMRSGGWQTLPGRVLRGKQLGLVGLGRLGRQMVPIARTFGMQVGAWSPHLSAETATAAGVDTMSREDLFAKSDVVSLHLVLGETTRGLVGEDDLQRMKSDAVLVNTARAGLVDTRALIAHLAAGRIAGAAIDVFDQEPLPSDHPLRSLPNVILTPHLGYATEEQLRAFLEGTRDHLLAWLRERQ